VQGLHVADFGSVIQVHGRLEIADPLQRDSIAGGELIFIVTGRQVPQPNFGLT